MDASPHRDGDLARADALRRRLYRPDATEADRREYESLVATLARPDGPMTATGAAQDEPLVAEETTPPARRPRRAVAVGVGAAVVGLLATAAVVQQTAAPTLLLPAVPTRAVTIGPAPDEPVRRVEATSGPDVQQFRGRGPGTAALDPLGPTAADLEIMITLGEDAPVRWTARISSVRLNGDSVVQVLGDGEDRQARAVPSTYRYRGAPPTSIRLDVPTGVAWNLVVLPAR